MTNIFTTVSFIWKLRFEDQEDIFLTKFFDRGYWQNKGSMVHPTNCFSNITLNPDITLVIVIIIWICDKIRNRRLKGFIHQFITHGVLCSSECHESASFEKYEIIMMNFFSLLFFCLHLM